MFFILLFLCIYNFCFLSLLIFGILLIPNSKLCFIVIKDNDYVPLSSISIGKWVVRKHSKKYLKRICNLRYFCFIYFLVDLELLYLILSIQLCLEQRSDRSDWKTYMPVFCCGVISFSHLVQMFESRITLHKVWITHDR